MNKPLITTVDDARDAAINWQDWQRNQALSYSDMADWAAYFAALADRFPELLEEFLENGVI